MFRFLTWKIPSGSTTKKTFQAGQIKPNISALRASCGYEWRRLQSWVFSTEDKKSCSLFVSLINSVSA